MPCRLDVLQAYVEGKKFVKLKGNADFNYHALEPFIIPSRYKRYGI